MKNVINNPTIVIASDTAPAKNATIKESAVSSLSPFAKKDNAQKPKKPPAAKKSIAMVVAITVVTVPLEFSDKSNLSLTASQQE